MYFFRSSVRQASVDRKWSSLPLPTLASVTDEKMCETITAKSDPVELSVYGREKLPMSSKDLPRAGSIAQWQNTALVGTEPWLNPQHHKITEMNE